MKTGGIPRSTANAKKHDCILNNAGVNTNEDLLLLGSRGGI